MSPKQRRATEGAVLSYLRSLGGRDSVIVGVCQKCGGPVRRGHTYGVDEHGVHHQKCPRNVRGPSPDS